MTTTVLHALALLAALGAAVVVLVVAVWCWCWCWFRWLDVETFGPATKRTGKRAVRRLSHPNLTIDEEVALALIASELATERNPS